MIAIPESHKDLLATDVAMLATLGPDGRPQVTALWFLFDDDGLVKLSLNTSRQKTRNLERHPECSFFVLDRANPYRTLELRGTAEISPDDDYAFANKVAAKYGGMDLRKMDGPGQRRVVVTLRPLKVNIWPRAQ
jgi:PPOX class probable F420-dependent enzyme